MSDTEDRVPSFPAGTFRGMAEYESVRMGASEDRTEQISVRIRCLDTDKDVRGKSILWFGNFKNQQAIDITTKALMAMGWDGASPIGIPGGADGALCGLGGPEFEFVVKHEAYGGKTRAKVAFVNALGAGFEFKNKLGEKELGSLNDRVKRHLASTAHERPVRSAQPQASGVRHAPRQVEPKTSATAHPTVSASPTETDEERLRRIDRGEDIVRSPKESSDPDDNTDNLPF